ncbi:hypothetical protein COCOBI_01-6710 [Coccomyxa sp. Obi]|nr:hypothetical protein COCOBI_01-6710 [Coccomyxa sp. Obi]
MRLPSKYINGTQGPYNPAAIRLPNTGDWLAFFRIEEVWFGLSKFAKMGTNLEERMRSHPLLVKMGNGTLPSTGAPAEVRMFDLDEGYRHLAKIEGAQVYKAADWRPFLWRNELYVGHWIAYMPGQERMAISKVDLQNGVMRLVHRFSTLSSCTENSLMPNQGVKQPGVLTLLDILSMGQARKKEEFRREKNWGFWEDNGKLYILYGILPCTVVLEFNPDQPSQPSVRSRTCYVPEMLSILQASGLDMMSKQIHLSGNPVPWDIDRGSSHEELFVMLHAKNPEYVNWAVRMDRKTHSITHITAGPLLRNQDYRNEGFLKTALVVSSFHVLPRDGEPGATLVRIFYGEGDRYGCWLDINTESIVWHKLGRAKMVTVQRKFLRVAPM